MVFNITEQGDFFISCETDSGVEIKFVIGPIMVADYLRGALANPVFAVNNVTINFGYFLLEEDFIVAVMDYLPSSNKELEVLINEILTEVSKSPTVVLESVNFSESTLLSWMKVHESSSAIN